VVKIKKLIKEKNLEMQLLVLQQD